MNVGGHSSSRKRRKSENSVDMAKKDKRRKTIGGVEGIDRRTTMKVSRANKSLTIVSTKKLKNSFSKISSSRKSVKNASTPKSSSSPSSKLVGARIGESSMNSSAKSTNSSKLSNMIGSDNKRQRSPAGRSPAKLLNTDLKSKIPKRLSISGKLSKLHSQKSLGISKKSITKIPRGQILKKSVLDRVVKEFSPSKRAAPVHKMSFVTKLPSSSTFVIKKRNSLNRITISHEKDKTEPTKSTIIKKILSPRKNSLETSIKNINSPRNVGLKSEISFSEKIKSIREKTPKPLPTIVEPKNSSSKKINSKHDSMSEKTPSKKSSASAQPKTLSPKKSFSPGLDLQPQSSTLKLSNSTIAKSSGKGSINKTPNIKDKIDIPRSTTKKHNCSLVVNGKVNGEKTMKDEIKKMSYSSAVKRKAAIGKPQAPIVVTKPVIAKSRNLMFLVNKKPAFSNRHINSPDPIVVTKPSLKSNARRSAVMQNLKVTSKYSTPKFLTKASKNTPKIKTPNISKNRTPNISKTRTPKNADEATHNRKGSVSLSKAKSKEKEITKSTVKNVTPIIFNTPSGDRTHNTAMKNRSVLKSSLKQKHGQVSCKKVNFDMSNLSLSSRQGDIQKNLSINSLLNPETGIGDLSKEPSKCFLAALELSCEGFLDGTTIINSPSASKRTRRSSTKSQYIHASTPIHSVQRSAEKIDLSHLQSLNNSNRSGNRSAALGTPLKDLGWFVNSPASDMLVLPSDSSRKSISGSSKGLGSEASKNILNLSKTNVTLSHELSPCELFLTPHITAETLNISLENFVSPLSSSASLSLKKTSKLVRKSSGNLERDSVTIFSSPVNSRKVTRQMTGRSQSVGSNKTESRSNKRFLSFSGENLNSSSPKRVSKSLPVIRNKPSGSKDKKNVSAVKKSSNTSKVVQKDVEAVDNLSYMPSPKTDFTDISGVKNILKSPRKSPKNDLSDVRGVKRLLSSPQKSPKNDLSDVSGVKKLFKSSRKSPKNDLSDVRGVKRLLSSPQKSPKNDLSNVSGVKKLLKSPRKSPNNDLSDVRGVKRLLSSPQKSPKNDLRDVSGLKKVFKSPRKSPNNDLSDVRGVKRLLSSPQKSPKNDLRDVSGLKKLFKSPRKSPNNDLSDVRGVKRLLSSPQKSPKNDLSDVRGVKRLLSSPQKSPKNDLSDASGVEKLLKSPPKSPDSRMVVSLNKLLSTSPTTASSTPIVNVNLKRKLFDTKIELSGKISKSIPPADDAAVDVVETKSSRRTRKNIVVEKDPPSAKTNLTTPISESKVLSRGKKRLEQETVSLSKPTPDKAVCTPPKVVAIRRTRKNVQSSSVAGSPIHEVKAPRMTSRKRPQNMETPKPSSSKKPKQKVQDEIIESKKEERRQAQNRTGRRTEKARKSSVVTERQRKSNSRKSIVGLVVSTRKVHFNPRVQVSQKGKKLRFSIPLRKDSYSSVFSQCEPKATRRKQKNSVESIVEKATPVQKTTASKRNRVDPDKAVSKSSEVKTIRRRKNDDAGSESTVESASSPVQKATASKRKRVAPAKAVSKSSEGKTTRRRNNDDAESESTVGSASSVVQKATAPKGKRVAPAKAVSKSDTVLSSTRRNKDDGGTKENDGGTKENDGGSAKGKSSPTKKTEASSSGAKVANVAKAKKGANARKQKAATSPIGSPPKRVLRKRK